MRMGTLDRYIIRNFLASVGIWLVVLLLLLIMAHLAFNMDEFTEDESSGMWGVFKSIVRYYGYHSLDYIALIGGLVLVTGAAFAVARMNHTNELTAMLASGVSLHRVVVPVIFCSIVLNGLLLVDREFILPYFRNELIRDVDDLGGKERFSIHPTSDQSLTVWMAASYDPPSETMTLPRIVLRDRQFRYLLHILADEASPGRLGDESGWMAKNATLVRQESPGRGPWRHTQSTRAIYSRLTPEQFVAEGTRRWVKEHGPIPAGKRVGNVQDVELPDPDFTMLIRAERFEDARMQDGGAVPARLVRPYFEFRGPDDRLLATIFADEAVWTPGSFEDQHWTLKGGKLFEPTDLGPEELMLRQSGAYLDYMSSAELSALLRMKNVLNPGEIRLMKYIRIADPFNNLVMLFLGLPFVLSRERNLKFSGLLCLLTIGGFFVMIYGCRYIGLPDFWAAFAPALTVGPVSVIMLDAIKT